MKRRAESWERAGWLSGGAAETWPEAETVGGHGRAGLEMWVLEMEVKDITIPVCPGLSQF